MAAGLGSLCSNGRGGCTLLASQLDLGFESCSIGVVGLECCLESIVGGCIEFAAALFRPVQSVSERLSRLVRQLAGAKGFESGLPVVERVLRHFAGAVELLFQSIE
jgi:hypothetical protein